MAINPLCQDFPNRMTSHSSSKNASGRHPGLTAAEYCPVVSLQAHPGNTLSTDFTSNNFPSGSVLTLLSAVRSSLVSTQAHSLL
jgi:hypothetical protein